MKTRIIYFPPVTEVINYKSLLCSNTYDPGDESGLIDIASTEKDASLGQANEFSFDESDEMSPTKSSLWDN